jgi:hypothetical protein
VDKIERRALGTAHIFPDRTATAHQSSLKNFKLNSFEQYNSRECPVEACTQTTSPKPAQIPAETSAPEG